LKKILAVLAIAPLLAGCAGSDVATTDSASPTSSPVSFDCAAFEGGAEVESISVPQGFGLQPEAVFPIPLNGDGIQTKVLVAGDGQVITGNQQVLLHFAAYNATTGLEVQASEFGTANLVPEMLTAETQPNFCHALSGVKSGSRVAVLLDPVNAHAGNGIESLAVASTDSLVFIFDVVDVFLAKATGESKPVQAGFPAVILAPSGQPGLQIPNSEAPTEFMRNVLIEGDGAEIAIGDSVSVHYSGFLWSEGTQFDSSWDRGEPSTFTVSNEGLIEGFVLALEGVKVGSQVIAVIPAALAYGEAGQGQIPPGATLVFVIDVLGKLG
jgi:peptidylprolyl isomerase